jgi:hypothetical protein
VVRDGGTVLHKLRRRQVGVDGFDNLHKLHGRSIGTGGPRGQGI